MQEVPEEECNLLPKTVCHKVTKIVPNMVPHEECVDVPKDVCVNARVNPKKVVVPVIKRWCVEEEDNEEDATSVDDEVRNQ